MKSKKTNDNILSLLHVNLDGDKQYPDRIEAERISPKEKESRDHHETQRGSHKEKQAHDRIEVERMSYKEECYYNDTEN